MRPILQLLAQHKDLRLVLGAGLVSLTGDWMLRVGLAYQVYVLTGSTLASAVMLLASFVPQILLSSVAGVFVDRWDRKTTMVLANLLLALGLLPLLLVHDADRVWVVYAVTAWEGIIQLFFAPAEQAMIPRLVPDEQLVTANALVGQNDDVSRLVGSALGGAIVAWGGISALTMVDIVSFLVSAALIVRVRTPGRPLVEPPADAGAAEQLVGQAGRLRRDWVEGLRMSTSQHVLRVILVFLLVVSIGEGIMGTLFAPFVRDVLHASGQSFGLIVSAQAVGGIVGGLVAASVGHRVSAASLFGWGAIAFGIIDLVMFLYPLAWVAVWPAVACMVLVGLPGALTKAGFMTLFQRNTTDAYRGRVFGAVGVVEGVAMVTGTLSAGFLGESVGIVPILALQGAGYALAGCGVLYALRRHFSPETLTPRRDSAGHSH